MKKTLLFFVLLILLACSEEKEADPRSGSGCLTGIKKGTNYRVTIRCATYQQYAAGNNINAGGTSDWTDYTGHKWEKCADCN